MFNQFIARYAVPGLILASCASMVYWAITQADSATRFSEISATHFAPEFNTRPSTGDDIVQALQSRDPHERLRALSASFSQQVPLPAYRLHQLANTDADPHMRLLAMTAFARDPNADPSMLIAMSSVALRDSDAAIKALAKDLLNRLDRATRSMTSSEYHFVGHLNPAR
ncbi:MAG: hypothetical protein ABIP64_06570 [Burkholderiales bacterium]